MSVARPTRFRSYGLLILVLLLVTGVHADTRFTSDEAHIQGLVAAGKFKTAAEYIADRKELLARPHFVRLYTHIVTTDYALTINFSMFALTDLKKGQRIEDVRGKPGKYSLIGGPLDDLLYKRIKEQPNSPELNFAVGEYLSRGSACGCRQSGPLKDLSGDDGPYFIKAYRHGVSDGWSLFRIGLYYHKRHRVDEAIAFYRKALAKQPDNADANYNLAFLYYGKGDLKPARRYVEHSLKEYRDRGLKADAYALHGVILLGLNDNGAGERSLKRALELQSWNRQAFSGLLGLYRQMKQHSKYVSCAEDFIAVDYGNTYLFNTYVDFLSQNGQGADDRRVERYLLGLKLKDAQQNGALYYNLARMADMRDDRAAALKRYRRSLAALKSLQQPPQGAIPAITERIAQLERPEAK